MTTIADPGKGLDKEKAKAAREKGWKRPATKATRDKARKERQTAWEASL